MNYSRSPPLGPLGRPRPMRLPDTGHVPFRLDDCRRTAGRPRPARRHRILLLSGTPDDDHRHDLPNAEIASAFTQEDYVALGIGLVVSFIVAWAVIAAFLTFVQRHSLSVFAYYRMVLGVIVLLGRPLISKGKPDGHRPRVRYLGQRKERQTALRRDDHESEKALDLAKQYLVGIGNRTRSSPSRNASSAIANHSPCFRKCSSASSVNKAASSLRCRSDREKRSD